MFLKVATALPVAGCVSLDDQSNDRGVTTNVEPKTPVKVTVPEVESVGVSKIGDILLKESDRINRRTKELIYLGNLHNRYCIKYRESVVELRGRSTVHFDRRQDYTTKVPYYEPNETTVYERETVVNTDNTLWFELSGTKTINCGGAELLILKVGNNELQYKVLKTFD